jgi:hypothetical protein
MNTCGLVGQVAGELAAHCVNGTITLKEMKQQNQYVELQQKLLKNDLSAYGISNLDCLDKVQEAVVTDNGTRTIGNEPVNSYMDMKENTFLICPYLETEQEIQIKLRCKETTEVNYTIFESDLPSRLNDGKQVDVARVKIKQGEVRISVSLKKIKKGYAKIIFEANPHIQLAITNESITGFLAGYKDSPAYYTPCVVVSEKIYDSKNIANGYNRIYRETNVWVSSSIAQGDKPFLCFQWDKPQKIKQIRFTFNPGLEYELPSSITIGDNPHHGFVRRTTEAKELVKSFRVYAVKEGREQLVAEVKDNYQRLCVVNIEEIVTDEVKIEFLETYGSEYIEVFEIRMY